MSSDSTGKPGRDALIVTARCPPEIERCVESIASLADAGIIRMGFNE